LRLTTACTRIAYSAARFQRPVMQALCVEATMKRKSISQKIQAAVLLRSRRRCCICFGLNRDTSIKAGQIAHLDGNPSNNEEDNLAFLCFDHHDQYDSTTRQSKNFTPSEVLHFREELINAIDMAFSAQISFGEATAAGSDKISGHYIRGGEYESADMKIQRLPDGKYHVSGLALWGKTKEFGPNIGELDFVGDLVGNTIEYTWTHPGRDPYRAIFNFKNGKLTVEEENWVGMFGMNVWFQGEYDKAT